MKKFGFTLVEILVVIAILAVLAAVGIGAYSLSKRTITLDLEAEKIVSALHEMRNKSKIRTGCFGIAFKRGEPARVVEAEYKNPAAGCGQIEETKTFRLGGALFDTTATVLFSPPDGKMTFKETEDQTLSVMLSFNGDYSVAEKITLDRATGRIEKE